MNLNKKISIIIPCFKQAHYLDEALNSVLIQKHQSWECIVVNDGSPDNTEEIAIEWCKKDTRFKYFKKENGGLSSARNYGLKMAEGVYIQFLDSDDILEINKLSQQVCFLINNPEVDIVYSGSSFFFDKFPDKTYVLGRKGMVPTINLDKNNNDQLYPFLWRNITTICSTLYKRSVFDKVTGFDEMLRSLEDWDFHFSCARRGLKFHFHKADEAGVLIRIHQGSMLTDPALTRDAYYYLMEKIRVSLSEEELLMYKELGLPTMLQPESDFSKYARLKRFIKRYLWRTH